MNKDLNLVKELKLDLASPREILEWSSGEVKKPETINYKSQKCEKEGLFCERIFGPTKDFECFCGKFKKIRHKNSKCDRCEVDIVSSQVRRQRLGHINLAASVFNILYLNDIVTTTLGIKITLNYIKEIIYFVSHVVLESGKSKHFVVGEILSEDISREKFIKIIKEIINDKKTIFEEANFARDLVVKLQSKDEAFDFLEYSSFISRHTGAKFGIGADAILELLGKVKIGKEINIIKEEIKKISSKKMEESPKFKKLIKRLKYLTWFKKSKNSPEWMVLKYLPVLPPDLRPMVELDGGRFTTSDINDLYRRVIIRNNRLNKLLKLGAPKIIIYNEKRMLQESVDALYNNESLPNRKAVTTSQGNRPLKSISELLKGKQGRFRQNLLGKRVDYSGRSVIAVGPELKMYECGIPRIMAATLFKPFIIQKLVEYGDAPNIKAADRMIESNDSVIWPILEEVIQTRPVILNRAPTLHRLGIQAFMPKLIRGKAIRLHPLVTPAFNADFDGDQMAVHVPLSKEAVVESQILMIGSSNILNPKDGKPIVTPSQDMVFGNYFLTMEKKGEKGEGTIFKDYNEVIQALENTKINLHSLIIISAKTIDRINLENVEYIITTPGKLIFNQIFSSKFPYINSEDVIDDEDNNFIVKENDVISEKFKNYEITQPFKKGTLSRIISLMYKKHTLTESSQILDKLKDLGFKYSTKSGITVAIGDFEEIENKDQMLKEASKKIKKINKYFQDGLLSRAEQYRMTIKHWENFKDTIQAQIQNWFVTKKENPILLMANSGARGNISNFTQLFGMRGLMTSSTFLKKQESMNPLAKKEKKIIEIPVKSSFIDGLSVFEFFNSTPGVRKGLSDTAFETGESGYLTRILVDSAQDVIVVKNDCGSTKGYLVKSIKDTKTGSIIVPLEKRLEGRISREEIKDKNGNIIVRVGDLINDEQVKEITKLNIEQVEIRSCVTCDSHRGVCSLCYGKNLAIGELVEIGEAVGVIAAQSLGEPGTQLTMRNFHTGGAYGAADFTKGLPRILELLRVIRNLSNKSCISEINGKVVSINEKINLSKDYLDIQNEIEQSVIYDVVVQNEYEEKKYQFKDQTPRVKEGDMVKIGQKISEGVICPRDLLGISDETLVHRYIIKEVQRTFALQGIDISDKHIEIFTKKMLRKVVVLNEGDSSLVQGEVIDRNIFTIANEKVFKKGERPAIAIPHIEGIINSSSENESFIASSSFEVTFKPLREAAIEGRIDHLMGIKENVVVGNLIPVGTGINSFRKKVLEKYNKLIEIQSK